MSKIEKFYCDNCGKEIDEDKEIKNATTIYREEKMVFKGSLCKKCDDGLSAIITPNKNG